MSNKRMKTMSDLPTMVKDEEVIKPRVVEPVPSLPTCESVSLTLPFIAEAPMAASFQDEAHRVDMGTLSRERMRKVKALRRGLVASDIRLEGGAEVRTNRDAIFCLLDMLEI